MTLHILRPRSGAVKYGLLEVVIGLSTQQTMQSLNRTEPADKDAPLRYDIRLLGRILGDTIRLHEGERVFDVIEAIRQIAIRFHRNADEEARHELQRIISALPIDQGVQIIRAFGYFSHLANLAEDQHHIRRVRAHAMATSPPRAGTMAHALAREVGRAAGRQGT